MKKSNLVLGVFALILTISFTSCLNEDNKIPPNCYDGILNNDEEYVDCGGEFCDACDPCENGLWNPELGETWVDCGGDCGPCPTESNGCQDGDETGVDCGGSTGVDCNSLCDDGLPNGFEDNAAVDCISPPGFPPDCGGPCEPCPTCEDETMNQQEIGIDCGGSGCPDCATDGNCLNNFVDGDEVYIDCARDPDAVGFCPQCDIFLTATVNGQAMEFNLFLMGSFAGNTVTASGQNALGDQITIAIPEPDGGWPLWFAGGLPTITSNLSSTDAALGYNEVSSGQTFASNAHPSGMTLNVSYIDTDVPGFMVATFSGNMSNVAGTAIRTFANGKIEVFVD